jgi:hypothetical protein
MAHRGLIEARRFDFERIACPACGERSEQQSSLNGSERVQEVGLCLTPDRSPECILRVGNEKWHPLCRLEKLPNEPR